MKEKKKKQKPQILLDIFKALMAQQSDTAWQHTQTVNEP